MRRGFNRALCGLVAAGLACSSAGVCGAQGPAPAASDDAQTPVIPRFQGPWQQGSFDPGQELWGMALVVTGSVVGGLGLYALETRGVECVGACASEAEAGTASPEVGTGLLVGGIFIAGVGLYLIATAGPRPTRIVARPEAWSLPVLVEVMDGGGLIGSRFTF